MSRVSEEINWQVIAFFGSVYAEVETDGMMAYWQRVWEWFRANYPDRCDDPHADYPMALSGDIKILSAMHEWQGTQQLRNKTRQEQDNGTHRSTETGT